MRHSLQRVLILTIAVIASAIPLASFAYDVRYWVWQRDNPLEPTGVGGVRGAENRYDLLAGRRIGEHQRDLALESAASRVSLLTELGARETVFYKPAAPNGASAIQYIVFHPSQNFLALRLHTRVRRKRAEN